MFRIFIFEHRIELKMLSTKLYISISILSFSKKRETLSFWIYLDVLKHGIF